MKTVVVTGASKGIGRAVVEELLNKDYRVIAVARNFQHQETDNNQECQNYQSLIKVVGDVREDNVLNTVLNHLQNHELVSLILSAAYISEKGCRIEQINDFDSELHASWSVNVLSPIKWIQKSLPWLRSSHGSIIYLSTNIIMPPLAFSGATAYASTKAAMTTIIRTLAIEEPSIGPVLAVSPGIVSTPGLASYDQGMLNAGYSASSEEVQFIRNPENMNDVHVVAAKLVQMALDPSLLSQTGQFVNLLP